MARHDYNLNIMLDDPLSNIRCINGKGAYDKKRRHVLFKPSLYSDSNGTIPCSVNGSTRMNIFQIKLDNDGKVLSSHDVIDQAKIYVIDKINNPIGKEHASIINKQPLE